MESRSQLIPTNFDRTRADKMAPKFAAIPSTAPVGFGEVDWTTLGVEWTTLGVTVELTSDVVGIEVELLMLHRSPWQQSSVQSETRPVMLINLQAVRNSLIFNM